MLIVALILLALGAVIWLFSRFGVTASHHPFCRACGFNLYMLPLETARCPECGADILAENAIRIGHRRPLRAGQMLAAVVSAVGILFLGAAVALWWPGFDGSPFKTADQLRHDLALPDVRPRDRALAELQRRIARGTLSAADTDALALTILTLQADPATHWDFRWGDLMLQAHLAPGSPLAPTRWLAYLKQSLQISATARPRVRSGDPIPIDVRCNLKAGFEELRPAVTLTAKVDAALADLRGSVQGRTQPAMTISPMDWPLIWQPAEPLPPGSQSLTLTITLTARETAASASQTLTLSLPIECLDSADSSVALVTPPATQPREDFYRALQWRLRASSEGIISLSQHTLGNLWIAGPPLPASFRIILRQTSGERPGETREWPIGRFLVQPGDASLVPLTLPAGPQSGGPQPGPAEIVCIPDPSLPTATTSVLEIWGSEIHHPVVLAP